MISGTTQVLGVIGHPIEHTSSPAMHNAALQALGLDAVYVAFHVQPDGLIPYILDGTTAILVCFDKFEVRKMVSLGMRIIELLGDTAGILGRVIDDGVIITRI